MQNYVVAGHVEEKLKSLLQLDEGSLSELRSKVSSFEKEVYELREVKLKLEQSLGKKEADAQVNQQLRKDYDAACQERELWKKVENLVVRKISWILNVLILPRSLKAKSLT